MLDKEGKILPHSFLDTTNNIIKGAKRYYNKWYEVKKLEVDSEDKANLIENDASDDWSFIDISDTSLLGLYRNNIEPMELKNVQKIIGLEYTYSYIAKKVLANSIDSIFNNYLHVFYMTKMNTNIIKMVKLQEASFLLSLAVIYDKYAKEPISNAYNFFIEQSIFGPKDEIKLNYHIKSNIIYRDKFLPLALKESNENEYRSLEENIVDVLTYYSNWLSTLMVSVVAFPLLYGKYKAISKYSPALGYSLLCNSALLSLEIIFNQYKKDIEIDIYEGNGYRAAIAEANIGADNYRLKETLFVAGSDNFYDINILNQKLQLEISEGNSISSILEQLFNFQKVQEIVSFFAGVNHNLYCKEKIGDDIRETALEEGKELSEDQFNKVLDDSFISVFGEFISINSIFFNEMKKIIKLFFIDRNFALKDHQIEKIIKAIDNYEVNRDKNLQIYENNNSTNLIISDLKAIAIADNKTIIDFSGQELSIDLASRENFLWEGQNSVGKSLLSKLIIGYSAGLSVTGVISYPFGFNTINITYILQDDYYAAYKPILHRLALPKLLPADITVQSSFTFNVMEEEEFGVFVDFMTELLFEMKYDPSFITIEDTKNFLIDNYKNYEDAINNGLRQVVAWKGCSPL